MDRISVPEWYEDADPSDFCNEPTPLATKVELKIQDILYKLFPRWYCPRCSRFTSTIERRRHSTMYEDEESNYSKLCQDCFDEEEEYWQERWEDYYRDVMW